MKMIKILELHLFIILHKNLFHAYFRLFSFDSLSLFPEIVLGTLLTR